MAKITYEYKTKLQDEPDIPNKNKVTDNDMNEIKDVVNANADELDTAKENIENLEEGQGTNNTDITNLKGRVTTLEEDNVKNKSDISNLQKDNETNKTNISNLQNTKVDKTEGKGLSTEDFTTELKTKLEGLENYNDAEIKGKIQTLETDNITNKTNISNLQGKVTNLEEDNTTNKDNITNLQKDVEDLGEDIETNTTNIETLQAENKNLKEEIESYQNSLPRETQSGEYITINNTADKVRFKDFILGGNSKQASRSGKNILNINSPDIYLARTTIEIEENVLHAETNGDSTACISIPLILKPNTDYTLSGIAKVIENTVSYANFYLKVRANKNGGDWISGSSFSVNTGSTENKNIDWTFNSKEYTEGWLWIYLKQSADAGNISVDFTDLQVEEGTEATDYEEYGATPSPEIPAEIENVEGDVVVTVANKNIANSEQLYQDMFNFNSGVRKEVVDGRNCLVFSSSVYMSLKGFRGLQGIYKKNTRYAIRAMCRVYDTSITEGKSFYIQAFDKIGNLLGYNSHNADGANWIQFSFLTKVNSSVNHIDFSYGSSALWCLDMDSLEIYEATNVEEFVANEQQTVVFPLAQGQKLMLGDYLADDGIHHVRKQVVLDGSNDELWDIRTDTHEMRINLASYNAIYNSKILCNQLIQKDAYEETGNGIRWVLNSQIVVIASEDLNTKEMTIEEWRAYLSENSLILEIGVEEEIEAYTEQQEEAYNKLKALTTYDGQTNVYSTNSPSPVFTVTGIKDVNSMLTQVNSMLLERS